MLTDQDKELMNNTDSDTLAKWWCQINDWGWPDTLPDEPDPTIHLHPRRCDVMDYIVSKIGMKRCNREWNRERMTDKQHERFWATGEIPTIMKLCDAHIGTPVLINTTTGSEVGHIIGFALNNPQEVILKVRNVHGAEINIHPTDASKLEAASGYMEDTGTGAFQRFVDTST